MEKNKLMVIGLIILCIMLFFSSCKTLTPVIINEPPKIDIKDDMSEEELNYKIDSWAINIKAYIKELITQIKNKVPYIDLREKQKNKKKK